MSRTWINIVTVVVLAFVVLALPSMGRADVVDIKGRLAADDPPDPERLFPCKVHEVQLEKNKKCQIDLMSDDFDAYLRLVDPTGKEVAKDDDGAAGDQVGNRNNARIKYMPSVDGTFKIHVTSYSKGTGAYVLRVTKFDGPKIATEQIVLHVDGKIQADDPADAATKKPAKTHELKLKKGTYQFDMSSGQLDSYLRLIDEAGNELAKDDDAGGAPNARVRYVAEKDMNIKIAATTLAGGQGEYKLIVRALIDGKATELATPTAEKPSQHAGQIKATDEIDSRRPHPSTSHFVQLKAGKTYQIDLISEFDNFLRLENSAKQEISFDDDSGGNFNARIVFQCPADGRYRIIATSFNGGVGTYTLRVSEQ